MKKERIKYLLDKSITTIKEEGLKSFISKTGNFVNLRHKKMKFSSFQDVLFINGCALPHPERYRVDHQIEQLYAYGLTANKVFYENLTLDMLKYYRCFVFYRCPITPVVKEFIEKARYYNKKTFFDIDDLVINTKYTDNIPYIKQMSKEEKSVYDDGVIRMEKTLKMCDYLITTTEALARELKSYNKEVLINRNVASEKMAELSLKANNLVNENDATITLGYLSGSITHNPDFELIKPAIIKIMEKYPNVSLHLAGIIDVPDELKKFKNRIIISEFTNWQNLPKIISTLDINLAPLEKSIFNEAKSENKWLEAALCKVVTVASNFGAFKTAIIDGKTGILCNDDEWFEKLETAITDINATKKIANNAYEYVIKNKITTYSGYDLANFIESKLNRNIAFVLPSTNVSGGVNVVLKHCNILRNSGVDAMIISMDSESDNIVTSDGEVNVVSNVKSYVFGRFDTMVATLWATLNFVKDYPQVYHKMYLVQGFETDFGKFGQNMRLSANATYCSMNDIKYLTVSKWCQNWLKEKYHKESKYIPNGISLENFNFVKRDFNLKKHKIRILVEGNCKDFYKNVDESFKIIDKLDKEKYEIHYLSYNGEPKEWYYIDKFYHKVPYSEVSKIYQDADILIKSSLLESFSYPPLEMMATGGLVVVIPNDGNVEYLKDGYNCLFYNHDDINGALTCIKKLTEDEKLRDKLIANGLKTAQGRAWNEINEKVIEAYESSK